MAPHPDFSCRRNILGRLLDGCLFVLAFLLLTVGPVRATTLRPLNLEELTRKAGDIVVGRCIAVEADPHADPSMPVTKVTVRVDRALKGKSGKTFTFRIASPSGSDSSNPGVLGVPRFRPGEDLILFLYPSSHSGLTSPVGLGQGKFVRVKGKNGEETVVNEFGNRSLFRNLSPGAEKKVGHGHKSRGGDVIPSSDLVRMVEELSR